MTSADRYDNGRSEVSLFEAISHETRIRMLFILRDTPLGFSELKNRLGLKSSGNLQHHLGKLDELVCLNEEGSLTLTNHGRAAVMAIQAVRRTQKRKEHDREIIALIFSFSMYIGFMNAAFLIGTVNAQTPIFSLAVAVIVGAIMYLMWPWIMRYTLKNQT